MSDTDYRKLAEGAIRREDQAEWFNLAQALLACEVALRACPHCHRTDTLSVDHAEQAVVKAAQRHGSCVPLSKEEIQAGLDCLDTLDAEKITPVTADLDVVQSLRRKLEEAL